MQSTKSHWSRVADIENSAPAAQPGDLLAAIAQRAMPPRSIAISLYFGCGAVYIRASTELAEPTKQLELMSALRAWSSKVITF
jgi:hypothetical protein